MSSRTYNTTVADIIIVVLFTIIFLLAIHVDNLDRELDSLKIQAIELEYAEYDSKSGEWTWK